MKWLATAPGCLRTLVPRPRARTEVPQPTHENRGACGFSLGGWYEGPTASFGVLLFAAVFMFWQAQNQAEDLANEDSALLSEALPPNALLDKGFQSWVSSGTPAIQE